MVQREGTSISVIKTMLAHVIAEAFSSEEWAKVGHGHLAAAKRREEERMKEKEEEEKVMKEIF